MQNSELPVTFHCNTVNSNFWLYLNNSLKRALAIFIGIAQQSVLRLYICFFGLRVFTGPFILQMSGVL